MISEASETGGALAITFWRWSLMIQKVVGGDGHASKYC